ncbi:SLAM family member 9-like isoform X4 [Myxocyprinus asiaticus]|uniref:SLAM family member 9-like isoform X1 n=1 Tax=Myxocyprinus asiaticus TaxID=70543 RepID=UPI0022233F9A|nr:SLAM family member 9-like isoform X1 [Myxocyprinus asiaticus]XP_051551233.1 SLAM family member 9-like isoform X3 [Myxocyprinus asiaticus]XP_051551234.1 SLAM family member 9-like isoform X4 [Myxocyprinus asiaticus]
MNNVNIKWKMFHTLLLFCLFLWHVVGVFGVERVSVMEGDSVTLHTDVTEIQRDDEIEWRFGPENIRIARIKRKIGDFSTSDDVLDGRFRGRLHLNNQTGSLTITNIRTEHTGLYELNIITVNERTTKRFSVTVYAHLPIPVIIRDSSQCSSSSKCVLVCSVVNVTQVTLSWYKGNSLFSSISVSDLNSSLSLPLEVEYQENNIYSCVINNPIRNQTQHLNINEVCQLCSAPNQESPSQPQNLSLMMPISAAAAAGTLFIAAVLMFCICRKYRKTDQEDQTRAVEIIYADPTYKRRTQKSIVKQEDDVVYAGVAVRY